MRKGEPGFHPKRAGRMTKISKRPLGKTGLEVTEVGLGGCFICEGATEHDEAIRVVHRALELGVNYIDTAPFYGNSQEVLGEALEGRKEPYYLGTKCGLEDGPVRRVGRVQRTVRADAAGPAARSCGHPVHPRGRLGCLLAG